MPDLAPIAIFAYNRPGHLQTTLTSLARCNGFAESAVVVFCDGPKTSQDRQAVAATRQVAQAQLGLHAEYRFREENAGLAPSIIGGVTEVVERLGRVIVLEDDLELSPYFLTYMNSALDRYANNPEVYQVSGQLFESPNLYGSDEAMFLPFTTSWGWGTWRRAWRQFDSAAAGWESLMRDRTLRKRFNLGGSYDFSTMLQRQIAGHGDSWAIRWYWSVFRNNGVVCFPPCSLIRNTGLDGSGTHGRGRLRKFKEQGALREITDIRLPDQVAVNDKNFDSIKRAIWMRNGGWIGAVISALRRGLFMITGRHM
jgi:Glycosyl transferase family 2